MNDSIDFPPPGGDKQEPWPAPPGSHPQGPPVQPPVQQQPPVQPPVQQQPPVHRPPVQQQPPVHRPPVQQQPPVHRPPAQQQPPVQPQYAHQPAGAYQQAAPVKKKKTGLIVGGVLALLMLVGGALAAVVALGGDEDATPPSTTQATATTVTPEEEPTTVGEVGVEPTVEELAHSTVQILVLDAAGTPTCTGSGTILDQEGTILTNAHVITPGGGCEVESIAIAITSAADVAPEITYIADLVSFDFQLDLAILRIASTVDGSALPESYPTTQIGDSDNVVIGDNIRILGYPGIGGSTITFTNGAVSGFTSQAGIGDRSWIKTDATIAGGNSGGTALNLAGEIIGIPTQASAGEDAPIVDCRVITDTNGDGTVDGADQCTPIGGFLNGIRPVNLAADLIAQAAGAPALAPNAAGEQTPAQVSVDPEQVIAYSPGFSLSIGETSAATDFVVTASAGIAELCFWFNWEEIPDGTVWDGVWLIDGEVIENFSYFGETWVNGTSGTEFWVCAQNDEGLGAGLYEFAFFIQDEIIFVEAIDITQAPVPVYQVEFQNLLDSPICYLRVNPLGAGQVGLDELGATQVIDPGQSFFMSVPEGTFIATAQNCSGEVVSGNTEGIIIVSDDVITIEAG